MYNFGEITWVSLLAWGDYPVFSANKNYRLLAECYGVLGASYAVVLICEQVFANLLNDCWLIWSSVLSFFEG